MTRLEMLAEAIKSAEGWYPFSRSWRNNNPGNLRFSVFEAGKSGGFAYFQSFAAGWLALWYDLLCKCNGKTRTGLTSDSTLRDLAFIWAPPGDGNDTEKYLKTLEEKMGISRFTKLAWFVNDI